MAEVKNITFDGFRSRVAWLVEASFTERTARERKRNGQHLFGIQTWMAVPYDWQE
jgi:hypothetical protein